MTGPEPPVPQPNFLVIGAGKAGTTALYYYLRQHPQVFMSARKEPYFFAYEGAELDEHFRGPGDRTAFAPPVTHWEDYLQLFAAAREAAIGEASAVYLYSGDAPARIRHYLPQARLIVMLRRSGREPLADFREALQSEEERVRLKWAPAWHYRRRGLYGAQVERYLALFPRAQLRLYLYEDWQADNLGVLRDIFRFLEIDDAFTPDISRRYNVGRVPRNSAWHTFLCQPHPLKDIVRPLFPKPLADRLWLCLWSANLAPAVFDPQVRAELVEYYRPDILRLQDLLQRDLSHWLEA